MALETREDVTILKQKLAGVSRERLVDAFTELALRWPAVCDVAEWLVFTPSENMARFTSRLEDMKTRDYRYPGLSVQDNIVVDLQALLRALLAGATSPREEMEGLLRICETDIISYEAGIHDDWSLSCFYHVELAPALASCSERVEDRQWLVGRLNEALSDDHFGIRQDVIAPVLNAFLSETENMASEL